MFCSINQDHRQTCKERVNNEVGLHFFVIYVIIIIISMYHYHLTCKERINNEVDPIGGVSSTAAFVEAAFVNLVRFLKCDDGDVLCRGSICKNDYGDDCLLR